MSFLPFMGILSDSHKFEIAARTLCVSVSLERERKWTSGGGTFGNCTLLIVSLLKV